MQVRAAPMVGDCVARAGIFRGRVLRSVRIASNLAAYRVAI